MTPNSKTKVYGADSPTFDGLTDANTFNGIAGLIPGDNITATYSVGPGFTAAQVKALAVGQYAILAQLVDPDNKAPNYTINLDLSQKLTVTPAALTIKADDKSRPQGTANPTLTVSSSGFVNSDTASVLTGAAALSTTATATSAVGTYAITAAVGTLGATNYGFIFGNGTLTVTTNTNTARIVRVVSGTGSPGSAVAVAIVLVSQGDENAAGFSLHFDPAVLQCRGVRLGNGAGNATILANTNFVNQGRVGVVLALEPGQAMAPGTFTLVEIGFMALPGSEGTATPLTFGDEPIGREVADVEANELRAGYVNGTVTVAGGRIGAATTGVNPLTVLRSPVAVAGNAGSPGSELGLVLTGESGSSYLIEVSTNLTEWRELTRGVNRTGTEQILDNAAAGYRQRFYRERVLAP